MGDRPHHQHRPQRPHRLSVPPRTTTTRSTTSRSYPLYPFPSPTITTPTPTPSKHRLSHSFSALTPRPPTTTKSSLSFLFILLFSLRSLYSLLPFLRSSPSSFSLFPFSFLVSLLSFFLTFSFSFSFRLHRKQRQPFLSFSSISHSQLKLLLFKSLLLAVVFLLRFQALRYCGTAAMILAEMSGGIAFRIITEGGIRQSSKVCGFISLLLGLFLLSMSWDRLNCFPLSYTNLEKLGTSLMIGGNCVRIWPMLLPFLSGFLGSYEGNSTNWVAIRQLGRRRVRLISLFFTTAVLFLPAAVSMLVFEASDGSSVSVWNLSWPLANTVLFGVLLNEWYSDEKFVSPKDFEKEFLVTFVCTIVLELVYFPELSLWGLLICGLLLWITVRQLNDAYSVYVEIGMESSESISALVMKPVRHILSERNSRKIALFLMINTGYMVVEFVAGFMSNSLGLISDACHMLFDCAALAIGLYASYISRLPANHQFNYGRGRFEVLSGYANAVFLVLVGALIVLESFERILDPQEISTNSLLAVSIGGLLVNVVGLIFFHEEHHHAHGGSCSHSHSHSHSHHDHYHSHWHTNHKHGEHSHDGSCSHSHSHSHSHHDHQHSHSHQDHDYAKHCIGDQKLQSIVGHDHHGDQHNHVNLHNHHDHGLEKEHHHHGNDGHDVRSPYSCLLEGHGDGIPYAHGEDSSCDHGCSKQKQTFDRNPPKESQKHHSHGHIDHNMEGIFLHVLADTMGSVGVIISTLLIKYKGWLVADPACSIFISVLIVSSVIPLLRNSAEILLQRVPRAHEQDLKEAVDHIMRVKGVSGIQNLHVWSLKNTEIVGTLNLHLSEGTDKVSAKALVSHILQDSGIKDLTIQVECVNS
ncbi:hypothetical protein Ancab_005802 [Ancistrocladus abbreviatus]